MKIGDAAKIYSAQLKDFWEQKRTLAKQKKDLEEKMKASPEAKTNLLMKRQRWSLPIIKYRISMMFIMILWRS